MEYTEAGMRKGPVYVFQPDDGVSFWQPLPANGYATIYMSPYNTPEVNFGVEMQTFDEGCHLREHTHPRCEELLVVVEGYGTAIIDGKEYPAVPGTIMFVGRHVPHSIRNESPGKLRMLAVIWPPGLEHVLEALGRPRKPGDVQPEPFEIDRSKLAGIMIDYPPPRVIDQAAE